MYHFVSLRGRDKTVPSCGQGFDISAGPGHDSPAQLCLFAHIGFRYIPPDFQIAVSPKAVPTPGSSAAYCPIGHILFRRSFYLQGAWGFCHQPAQTRYTGGPVPNGKRVEMRLNLRRIKWGDTRPGQSITRPGWGLPFYQVCF